MRPQAGRIGLRKYEKERGVELYAVLPFPSISHNYPLQGPPGGGPATKAVECSSIWTLESDTLKWSQSWATLPAGSVTFRKLLHFPAPQFPNLLNGLMIIPASKNY